MNRSSLRLWASGDNAEVKDPDLDPNHPGGTGGAGKYRKGWVPEKEPHQWINFLYGAQDEILKNGMEVGGMPRESGVAYRLGALSPATNGVWYVSTKANPSATDWTEVAAGNSKAVFDAWVKTNTNKTDAHKALVGPKDNIHNTTIAQAGGYTKQEANTKDNTNNTEINTHKALTNNPHKVSHVQLNCLSADLGGNFTGLVGFQRIVFYNGIYVDDLEMANGIDRFGISTVPWLSKTNQEVLTESSYLRIRTKHEPTFALPPEDIFIPLAGSLSSPTSGAHTLEYTRPSTLVYQDRSGTTSTAKIDEPAFEVAGMKLSADYALIFKGLMAGTGTLCYDLNGQTKVFLINLVKDDLAFYLGKVGNAKNLRIWLTPLTDAQKSMLGATNG